MADTNMEAQLFPQKQGMAPEYIATARQMFRLNRDLLVDTYYNAFKFDNVPTGLDPVSALDNLITDGFSITELYDGSIRSCTGVLTDFDFYHRPVKAKQVNPKHPHAKEHNIYYLSESAPNHNDCVLLTASRLKSNFRGFRPLRERFDVLAYKMTNADISIQSALFNSRVSLVFKAQDTAEAEAFKRSYWKISVGEPAIIENANGLLTDTNRIEFFPVKPAEHIDKLFESKLNFKNEFLEFLGVPTIPFEKKERLVTGELQNPYAEIRTNSVLGCLKNWTDSMNKVFGTSMSVSLNYDTVNDFMSKGVTSNASTDTSNE